MPKPFDATLKQLIRHHPADWLGLIGVVPSRKPKWIDAELSTVSASADSLLQVGNVAYHFEFEAGPDETLERRVLLYNALAHFRTGLNVLSTAVLLRSNAQHAGLTDAVQYGRTTFGFDIVRVWERSAEDFLTGPLGLAPLAVLGRPPAGQSREQALPGQVDRLIDRVVAEAGGRVSEFMTSSFILAGMHSSKDFLHVLFHRGLTMIESSAFALMESLAEERRARHIVLKLAIAKSGPPTDAQAAKLAAIDNLDRLDRLALRLLKVDSWAALLKAK